MIYDRAGVKNVREYLKDLTLPPQIRVELDVPYDQALPVQLLFVGAWEDSEKPGQKIQTYMRHAIDPWELKKINEGDADMLEHIIWNTVMDLWMHELKEWVRWKGVPLRAPHKPGSGEFA